MYINYTCNMMTQFTKLYGDQHCPYNQFKNSYYLFEVCVGFYLKKKKRDINHDH